MPVLETSKERNTFFLLVALFALVAFAIGAYALTLITREAMRYEALSKSAQKSETDAKLTAEKPQPVEEPEYTEYVDTIQVYFKNEVGGPTLPELYLNCVSPKDTEAGEIDCNLYIARAVGQKMDCVALASYCLQSALDNNPDARCVLGFVCRE